MAAINQFGGVITCIIPNSTENAWSFTFLVLRRGNIEKNIKRRIYDDASSQSPLPLFCRAECFNEIAGIFSIVSDTQHFVGQLHSETRTLVTFAFVQGSMRTINLYYSLISPFSFFFFPQIIDSKWRNYLMEEWKTLNRAGISRRHWLGLIFCLSLGKMTCCL